jgi:hypothetical protein
MVSGGAVTGSTSCVTPDTAGDVSDYPVPQAYRYRDYVIDAFNSDKPYDEFLREQLAGDSGERGAEGPIRGVDHRDRVSRGDSAVWLQPHASASPDDFGHD